MKKSWRRKGPRPELVGVFAGLGVLAAATAVAVTLLLARGADGRTTLQTGPQLDLILLTAFVAGLALFAGVRVAAAVRSAAGTSREHQLVQRALEIDYADPDALAEFEAVPPIRDLVSMLMAEKTQTRELGDRVETLHGELTSLGDGMQRTARDLGRMREEHLSAASLRVVAAWNGLLDRVKNAEAAATSAAAAPLRPEAEIGALVARLDELETELVRLQHAVDTGPAPAAVEHAPEPIADPWSNVPAAASVPVGLDADWGPAQDFVPQHRIATWNAAGGILEPTALPPVDTAAEEVDAAFASLTGETAPGVPGGVPEWQAAGELFLPEIAAEIAAAPRVPAPVPGRSVPSLDDTAFPHFVGRPVGSIPDRLEVTYETNSGEEVMDLPASALLFEPEAAADPHATADEAIDLRSLGATEFEA